LQGDKRVQGPKPTSIDWSKWNKEIPNNKPLMKEYGEIEVRAKADGTWMKNHDGTEFTLPDGEVGTPEQFVQVRSKAFKKAFPYFGITYRGAAKHNDLLFNKPGYTGVFSGDKGLASTYANNAGFYNRNSPTVGNGVHQLAMNRSSNGINVQGFGDDWTDLQFHNRTEGELDKLVNARQRSIDKITHQGKNNHQYSLDKLKSEVARNKVDGSNPRLSQMVEHFKKSSPSEGVVTDEVASYLENKGLDWVKLNNILDGPFGDITVSNQVPGNYLKSLRGNNGKFDMTNPNIYKALVPAVGVAGYAGSGSDNRYYQK
jgi:hypothetical protein